MPQTNDLVAVIGTVTKLAAEIESVPEIDIALIEAIEGDFPGFRVERESGKGTVSGTSVVKAAKKAAKSMSGITKTEKLLEIYRAVVASSASGSAEQPPKDSIGGYPSRRGRSAIPETEEEKKEREEVIAQRSKAFSDSLPKRSMPKSRGIGTDPFNDKNPRKK